MLVFVNTIVLWEKRFKFLDRYCIEEYLLSIKTL